MKRFLSILCISIFIIINLIQPVQAFEMNSLNKDSASNKKNENSIETHKDNIIMVALIEYGDFLSCSANGDPSGYAVDYLSEISKYTGWQYNYINMTYEDAVIALDNGEIDILCGADEKLYSIPNIDLSKFCMGYSSYMICTLDDRKNNAFNEFNSFNNLSIGFVSSLQDQYCNKQYIENNYDFNNIIVYDDYSSIINAFYNKGVDAILINELNYKDEYKIIAEFNPYPIYIAARRNSRIMQQINSAQSEMYLSDRYFNDNLYKKYFGNKNYLSTYTHDEIDYLKKIDSLNVYMSSNRGILFESRNGQYSGIQYDLLNYISEELGIEINIITQNEATTENFVDILYNGDIDLFAGYTYNTEWAEKNNVYITNPYINMNYYKIQRIDSEISQNSRISNEIVAAIPYYRLTNDIIATQYSEDRIIWKSNDYECIKAVSSGEADIAYVNVYTAEYYLNSYDFQNLSMSYIDYSNSICFAIPKNHDKRLVNILNKVISKMSHDEINNIVSKNIRQKRPVNMFKAFFVENTLFCTILIAVFISMFLFLIMLSVVNRIISKKNKQLMLVTNAKNEFFSRASHDIRTPMSSIIGLSNLGIDEENDDKKKQYFIQIEDLCKYLLGILNDTLDIGKLESKTLKLNVEPVAIKDFIEQLNSIVENKAKEKNIAFSIINRNKETENICAYFDKVHIFQIFVNLITNAIKFTNEGGFVSFIIENVNFTNNDVYNIEFHVVDNGIGMSDEFLPHIFESFSQEDSGNIPGNSGTGLGLTIVKNLVELMNGEISVNTTKGYGTDFKVIIPTMIVQNTESDEQNYIDNSVYNSKYAGLIGKKALVVEDNELNSIIVCKILENIGIKSDACSNGLEAVEKFSTNDPGSYDAILMDKRMPVMNGAAAIEKIRSMDRYDALTVPIIILTADVIEDTDNIKALRIDGYIMKPIEPEILYDMILKLCSK